MFDFNAKRRKIIVSFFCLSFSLVLITGCVEETVNIAIIVSKVSTVVSFIDNSKELLQITSDLVNTYYRELKVDINTGSSDSNGKISFLKEMEIRYSNLSNKQKQLDDSLEKTNENATDLFSTLEKRANQSSIDELKEKSLSDIRIKKQNYDEKMKIVTEGSLKLQKSIKNYDSILGFLQIHEGLKLTEKYINDIDSIISQYESLNQEVQIAINEGRQTITNIVPTDTPIPTPDNTSIPTPDDTSTPTPIPIPDDTPTPTPIPTPDDTPTPTPNENTNQQQDIPSQEPSTPTLTPLSVPPVDR